MVRVAGVLDQIHHGRTSRDASGMTPTEVMDGLVEKIHEFAKKQYSCYNRSIIPSLRSAGIVFKEADELDGDQKAFVEEYFEKVVFPVLTPMAVDTSRPFPMLANKSLNIAVRLTNAENEEFFALVQVPSILPRFLELPTHEGRAFILLEKISQCTSASFLSFTTLSSTILSESPEIPTLTLTRIPRILWLKLKVNQKA